MRASASPSGPSRWWRRLRPRASITAISRRSCTRKGTGARNLWRGEIPPEDGEGKCLLQTQRHEASFSVRIGDQKQCRLAAFLLELVDPFLHRVRIADRLILYLDHHVAHIEPLVSGRRLGFDAGDNHA